LDVIGLRVFLRAIQSHIYQQIEKNCVILVCNANVVYRNLKSEHSQDYARKPQRNCAFMNSTSGSHNSSFNPSSQRICFLYLREALLTLLCLSLTNAALLVHGMFPHICSFSRIIFLQSSLISPAGKYIEMGAGVADSYRFSQQVPLYGT
jgi:hypothetical protein